MWFRQFCFDAVLTEDIVPGRASLHLRVVVAEYVRNAMLPYEVLGVRSGPSLSVSHAITQR